LRDLFLDLSTSPREASSAELNPAPPKLMSFSLNLGDVVVVVMVGNELDERKAHGGI